VTTVSIDDHVRSHREVCCKLEISLFTDVVIGFEMEEYIVSELDGDVTLCVSVLEGNIGTNLTLEVSTINGSALCESILHCRALPVKIHLSMTSSLPKHWHACDVIRL